MLTVNPGQGGVPGKIGHYPLRVQLRDVIGLCDVREGEISGRCVKSRAEEEKKVEEKEDREKEKRDLAFLEQDLHQVFLLHFFLNYILECKLNSVEGF